MKRKLCVVDDERSIRELLKSRLEREGFEVFLASDAFEGEKVIEKENPSVLVTDLKMPGRDGFELIQILKEKFQSLKCIVITGHGEKEAAVQALKLGAVDYLEKPFDLDELSHAVKRAFRECQLQQENQELIARLEERAKRVEGRSEDKFWYVSKSKSMEKVNEWLTVLRRESMRGQAEEPTVLLLGESGVGKEGIARMVYKGSRSGSGPWVAVNCANFSEQLLESELFGHEKGAFTGANSLKRGLFEIAENGTLFLDEMGEMQTSLQSKLLRVLQEKTFRRVGGTEDRHAKVRIIAATNQNLLNQVKEGKFREDLYHRLSKVVIEIPPLRERREDILPMAQEFAKKCFESRGKLFEGFSGEAETAIRNYPWPGNVRELLNVLDRVALVWNTHGAVGFSQLSLPKEFASTVASNSASGSPAFPVSSQEYDFSSEVSLGLVELRRRWSEDFERRFIDYLLSRCGGNVTEAARLAQMDRSNFCRILRRVGVRAEQYRKVA